jgi:hypothetical protein
MNGLLPRLTLRSRGPLHLFRFAAPALLTARLDQAAQHAAFGNPLITPASYFDLRRAQRHFDGHVLVFARSLGLGPYSGAAHAVELRLVVAGCFAPQKRVIAESSRKNTQNRFEKQRPTNNGGLSLPSNCSTPGSGPRYKVPCGCSFSSTM